MRGVPVGVLLSIYSVADDGGETSIRCNLSSWYVEPVFRNYATMMAKVTQRHKQVTYINISPANWTWRTIETQGFRAYCSGLFFSFPALSRPAKGMRVEVVRPDAQAVDGLSEAEVALLARHARYGCLSLVCRTADGRGFPFVLQPMRIRRDRAAGDADDLLPRRGRLCRLRRCDRPASCSGAAGSRSLSMPTAACRTWSASTGNRSAANTSRARSVPGLPT